ncbi:MAG: hypothetical protein ACFN1I_00840 [Selenomonas artemidis]|jgi:hypothetical protein
MIASALDRALVRRFYEIVITVIVVTVAFFCCYMSFRDLHAKSDEMNDALSRWASNAAYINSQSYRPVLPEQVDAVSADIFNAVLAHRLGLVSFNTLPRRDTSDSHITYVLSLRGAYADTLSFLEDFHSKDALITIMALHMKPDGDQILTELSYRVYTK